jgi:hypothetical protein
LMLPADGVTPAELVHVNVPLPLTKK